MGIQMNHKELTKTFMIISNWNKPFGLHELYKINSAFEGLKAYITVPAAQGLTLHMW